MGTSHSSEIFDFSSECVLVTGGGGVIGSVLVHALLGKKAKVKVLDDWSLGTQDRLPSHAQLTVFTGSVCDPRAVEEAIQGVTIVIHLASTNIHQSLQDPGYDCDVNVKGTVNVLCSAKKTGMVRRVVYGSSDAVYGNPRYLPINEDDTVNPLSPFAVSKLAGEYYCRAFYEVYGLSTTVLRFGNVFGEPDPVSLEHSGVVTRFIKQALDQKPLAVHGDGEQTRDFIFIEDAVDAILRASLSSKADGQTYNVGSGIEVTINHLAELVLKLTRSQKGLEYIDRMDIDNIRRRVLNIEKIRRDLRWIPQYTLEQGLRRCLGLEARE